MWPLRCDVPGRAIQRRVHEYGADHRVDCRIVADERAHFQEAAEIAALLVGGVFGDEGGGPAVFAAGGEALDQPEEDEQDRGPEADRRVRGPHGRRHAQSLR